ncbi:hypothetical protein EDB85DRAFT_1899439 [Lactarius pseudohatsudake]|nr:hypothetical protein EDB85DRAFT_1899439 [Lactarius pseudohatsudake]
MSNATNSGDRMATRGDAKEKMSKVMAIIRSGGIEDSDLPEDGKTAKKGKKKSKGVKKSKDVLVSRLAELEDAFMKKAVDARSSHPRRWMVDLEDSRAKTPDSESENDGVDETAEHNERHSDAGLYAQAATPRPRSVRPQAATPWPRPVHPQKGTGEESRFEDLDTAPQVKEKAAVRGAITRVDAETANADETRPQDTDKTVKASSNSKSAHAVATHPIHKETQKPDKGPLSNYGLEGDSDDDEESDSDGPPPKNSKTKAAGKKKTKGAKAKLIQEQIKSNHKLVTEARPNLENGGKKTFNTPDAKININASVSNWRHRLSPPNSPPPNSKRQKVQSVKASTIVSKVTSKAKTTSAKSASCAVVSTSTSSVLAKLACRAKHRYEELESASDASDEVEGMAPGGMDDDYDDALEQAAAVSSPLGAQAAAQRNKSQSNKETEEANQQRTPGGALDAGRWSGIFIPTFLRYLGGMEKDIWAFKRKDAVHVLQAVWNTVYAGSTDGSIPKIKHLVEIGGAMHEVVHPSRLNTTSVRKSGPMNRKKTGTGPDCNRWRPDRRLRFIRPEDFTGCGSSKFGIWVNRHRAGWDRSQPVFTTTATRRRQHRQPWPTTVRPQFRHPPHHLQHRHQHQVGPASTIAPPHDNPDDNLKTTTTPHNNRANHHGHTAMTATMTTTATTKAMTWATWATTKAMTRAMTRATWATTTATTATTTATTATTRATTRATWATTKAMTRATAWATTTGTRAMAWATTTATTATTTATTATTTATTATTTATTATTARTTATTATLHDDDGYGDDEDGYSNDEDSYSDDDDYGNDEDGYGDDEDGYGDDDEDGYGDDDEDGYGDDEDGDGDDDDDGAAAVHQPTATTRQRLQRRNGGNGDEAYIS